MYAPRSIHHRVHVIEHFKIQLLLASVVAGFHSSFCYLFVVQHNNAIFRFFVSYRSETQKAHLMCSFMLFWCRFLVYTCCVFGVRFLLYEKEIENDRKPNVARTSLAITDTHWNTSLDGKVHQVYFILNNMALKWCHHTNIYLAWLRLFAQKSMKL